MRPTTDQERLDPQQFEAVLRRAGELQEQARRSLDRADAVRIARELGIEARHVEQALEELNDRRGGRDPYRLIAWSVLALGFVLVLLAIYRNLAGAF